MQQPKFRGVTIKMIDIHLARRILQGYRINNIRNGCELIELNAVSCTENSGYYPRESCLIAQFPIKRKRRDIDLRIEIISCPCCLLGISMKHTVRKRPRNLVNII